MYQYQCCHDHRRRYQMRNFNNKELTGLPAPRTSDVRNPRLPQNLRLIGAYVYIYSYLCVCLFTSVVKVHRERNENANNLPETIRMLQHNNTKPQQYSVALEDPRPQRQQLSPTRRRETTRVRGSCTVVLTFL